ncbi:MAG: transcription antitermination factor NusB [Phycisphaeraceae bacterium]|nr:transcription antitermination factor NusB [Phycisphaeraceae bacterium]
MATSREVRRLAFQALFQLDARCPGRGAAASDAERHAVRESLDDSEGFTPAERDTAMSVAVRAFADREAADAATLELAPTWPAHRQAAVDRALLRLAHYEMTRTESPPKVVVNDTVEIAKAFSTDKSPAFINALLDRILKRVLGLPAAPVDVPAPPPHEGATPG